MEQHDRRCAGWPTEVAHKQIAAVREVDEFPGWKVGFGDVDHGSNLGTVELTLGVRLGVVHTRPAQTESTLSTLTVIEPFGASYVIESPADDPLSAAPRGDVELMTSAPSISSSMLPIM